MASLNRRGDLAAAEIAFFAPALCIALFVTFRQGFSKQLGWFYLNTLSILRLIGASCLIYAEVNEDYSSGLVTTAAITSAIGTAPLLLVLLGFLERIHLDMLEGRGTNKLIFRTIHLASLVGFILAIIGGVDLSSASSPTGNDFVVGKALMETASIIFLAMYLTLAAITALTQKRKGCVLTTDRKLVYAGLISVPFLLVRMLYTVFVSFHLDDHFSFHNVNTWIRAFMQFLMEAIVVSVFIVAGLLTPKMDRTSQHTHHVHDVVEAGTPGTRYYGKDSTSVDVRSQPSSVEKPQRNLMDYRPSRLIRDAISKRYG